MILRLDASRRRIGHELREERPAPSGGVRDGDGRTAASAIRRDGDPSRREGRVPAVARNGLVHGLAHDAEASRDLGVGEPLGVEGEDLRGSGHDASTSASVSLPR